MSDPEPSDASDADNSDEEGYDFSRKLIGGRDVEGDEANSSSEDEAFDTEMADAELPPPPPPPAATAFSDTNKEVDEKPMKIITHARQDWCVNHVKAGTTPGIVRSYPCHFFEVSAEVLGRIMAGDATAWPQGQELITSLLPIAIVVVAGKKHANDQALVHSWFVSCVVSGSGKQLDAPRIHQLPSAVYLELFNHMRNDEVLKESSLLTKYAADRENQVIFKPKDNGWVKLSNADKPKTESIKPPKTVKEPKDPTEAKPPKAPKEKAAKPSEEKPPEKKRDAASFFQMAKAGPKEAEKSAETDESEKATEKVGSPSVPEKPVEKTSETPKKPPATHTAEKKAKGGEKKPGASSGKPGSGPKRESAAAPPHAHAPAPAPAAPKEEAAPPTASNNETVYTEKFPDGNSTAFKRKLTTSTDNYEYVFCGDGVQTIPLPAPKAAKWCKINVTWGFQDEA